MCPEGPQQSETPSPQVDRWSGEGWGRTQRQLGVGGLILCFVLAGLHVEVPIGIYSMIGGLLGLDILVEALDRVRGKK